MDTKNKVELQLNPEPPGDEQEAGGAGGSGGALKNG